MTDAEPTPEREPSRPQRLRELAGLFLRLGTTAFGGPAAHVAMMHDEVVVRRRWLSDQRFLDLLGATNLIPGPNSTEMAIHIGLLRAGWAGLLVAGISFIVPAMLIVLGLAWAYVRYGHSTAGEALLYGIEPVVIAIVVDALVKLGRTATRSSPLLIALGASVLAAYLAGVNELLLLFGSGVLVVLVRRIASRSGSLRTVAPIALVSLTAAVETARVELWRLFLQFLKFGAVVYGSGYVLFAFLRADLVERLGWLTQRQLVDALAVGQLTPGPVFTTATFIGYVLGGVGGAVVATIGMFLPAFVFVALLAPIIRLTRRSTWARDALDGVNVAAVGLMAGVCWQLGRRAIVDVPTAVMAVMALAILLRFRLNSGWLVLAGAAVGVVVSLVR
jgi:chromate transporter